MTYRHKPIVVEAFRAGTLRAAWGPKPNVPQWAFKAVRDGSIDAKLLGPICIKTTQGGVIIDDRDWILRNDQGNLSRCEPDRFIANYEPV